MGFEKILRDTLKTNDTASFRWHTDFDNLMQMILQIFAAYFSDDCADELIKDPVFTAILNKPFLASQPILSCFHNRMDKDTLDHNSGRTLRREAYAIEIPNAVLMDPDSTLLETYGKQEGESNPQSIKYQFLMFQLCFIHIYAMLSWKGRCWKIG